jgi:hypothetical protein
MEENGHCASTELYCLRKESLIYQLGTAFLVHQRKVSEVKECHI